MLIWLFPISLVLVNIFFIMILIRNRKVSKYRHKLIDKMYESGNWSELVKQYDAMDSYEMTVYKFWRPLDSFLSEDLLKVMYE